MIDKQKDQQHAEKIIKGVAKIAKKSEFQKLIESFLNDDLTSIKRHIIEDVIWPTVKKGISDAVDTVLYPNGGNRKRTDNYPNNYTPYNRYHSDTRNDKQRDYKTNKRSVEYDTIEYDNRGDAEYTLDCMCRNIDVYGNVTVGYLYESAGIQPKYTDFNYGWKDLRDARVIRLVSGNYILQLPDPVALD